MGAKQKDLIGKRFNFLKVVEKAPSKDYNGSKKRMWRCICDCGNEVVLSTGALQSENTTSCGCFHDKISAENGRKSRVKVANPDAAYNAILGTYKQSSKTRNIEFLLSKEEFKLLITSNCFYCGISPNNLYDKRYYKLYYNGIDRIENNIGYTMDNCVSCCKMCNIAKNNHSAKDFIKWFVRLYKHSIEKLLLQQDNDITDIVKKEPNDQILGNKLRKLYGSKD